MAGDGSKWRERLDTATRSASSVRRDLDALALPALTVLAHPELDRVGERAVLTNLAAGQPAVVSRIEPLFAPPRGGEPRPLADPRISRKHLVLRPATHGGLEIDPRAVSTELVLDGEPLTDVVTLERSRLERGVVLVMGRQVALLAHLLETTVPSRVAPELIGESAAVVHLRNEIARVADLDFPVILRGESGTGKELVARAIHDAGPRRQGPFFAVNIGAVPPTLAAAELFGADRGAYSGAERRRQGYFRRAHGGTLFLDEIGETPPDVQVLLLRALESGTVLPVGGEKPQAVDVRILSATDADLESAIADGGFRSPLLHRLASYEIVLPPLRDRRDDLGRLLVHFLASELEATGESHRLQEMALRERPYLPAELVARLALYDWPGNVRELRNVVRQLVVGNRGRDELGMVPAVERILDRSTTPTAHVQSQRPKPYRDAEGVSVAELRETLAAHRFEVKPTAAELGISRTALYELMQRHGIRRAAELDREEIERSRVDLDGDLDAMSRHFEVSRRGLKMRMKDLGLR